MTLTYIFHSGFVLETEKSILIFDYWLDINPLLLMKETVGCLDTILCNHLVTLS